MIKKTKNRKKESGISSFLETKVTEVLNLDKMLKNIDSMDQILKLFSAKK